MMIGAYKLGRYHAIIEKTYDDGTVDYETCFSSREDYMDSVRAIVYCMAKKLKCGTDNPRVIVAKKGYLGKEAVAKLESLISKD